MIQVLEPQDSLPLEPEKSNNTEFAKPSRHILLEHLKAAHEKTRSLAYCSQRRAISVTGPAAGGSGYPISATATAPTETGSSLLCGDSFDEEKG